VDKYNHWQEWRRPEYCSCVWTKRRITVVRAAASNSGNLGSNYRRGNTVCFIFFTVLLRKYRDTTINYATAAIVHIFSNSLFILLLRTFKKISAIKYAHNHKKITTKNNLGLLDAHNSIVPTYRCARLPNSKKFPFQLDNMWQWLPWMCHNMYWNTSGFKQIFWECKSQKTLSHTYRWETI
jgi:hypothetical protein